MLTYTTQLPGMDGCVRDSWREYGYFQAYGEFARVYDMFQDNVDYQTWGKWLKQQLAAQGITDGLVLDLGCGTGTMTEILAEAGYDMIGVDNSGEMLAEAMENGRVRA